MGDLSQQKELAMLAKSPTQVKRDEGWFIITLSNRAHISGCFRQNEATPTVDVERIEVDTSIRGNGIGTRLLKVFFKYCESEGAELISSEIVSTTAMHVRQRVLGEEALHFFGFVDDEEVELPMSPQQACQSIERAWEWGALSPGINAKVYLADVDTSAWEVASPVLE